MTTYDETISKTFGISFFCLQDILSCNVLYKKYHKYMNKGIVMNSL